jgi:tetratricopeptide (TPR) repeat protein
VICISRAAIAVTVLLAAVSIEPLFAWMELPQATAQLTKPAEDGEPGGADDFFSRGMQRWAKGDLQGAHSDFTRAIEIDPKHWHAYFRRALGLSAMKPEQALDDFGKAIELNPAHYNAYVSRSTLLRGRGDYRGAKADLDAAIALEPGNPAAYSNRAIIYWETGSNEEALLDMNNTWFGDLYWRHCANSRLHMKTLITPLSWIPISRTDARRILELSITIRSRERITPVLGI